MKSSKVLTIDPFVPQTNLVEQAACQLKTGKIIVFPTDTVYGVGMAVLDTSHPKALARAKNRAEDKAIALLIASPTQLQYYGHEVPAYAHKLAQAHWPGALTLVVKASNKVPPTFVAQDGSVALRVPHNAIALALLEAVDAPLATTSANLAGHDAACAVEELSPELLGNVSLVIDGGALCAGRASTVVSCLHNKPIVLRQGPIEIDEENNEDCNSL